jgi:gliding motility-associated-like protein
MKQFLLSFLSYFLFYSCCWAQGEDNVWIFGDSLGIDFNSSSPAITNANINRPHGGSASVSDANGQLLFYTDGLSVWDRTHNVMANGNISQAIGAASYFVGIRQNTLIVPYPENAGKYILFTLGGVWNNGLILGGHLHYSVVDMTLNGGYGDVIAGQNSILIDSGYNGGLTATQGDQCNIWLVSRKLSEYHAFEVTSSGINTTPTVSTFPNLPQQNSLLVSSCFKFSPDGSRMVANTGEAWQGNLNVKLYNFNKSNGSLSAQKLLLTDAYQQAEHAFSPDGTKLYVAITPTVGSGICDALIQFDLSLPSLNAINSSKTILTPIWGGASWFCVKASSNGKVYAIGNELSAYYNPSSNSTFRGLYEITQPNLAGAACMFNPLPVFNISNSTTNFSNENIGQNNDTFTHPPYLDTLVCTKNGTFPVINLKAASGYRQYYWSDGSSDTFLSVSQAGRYWVSYREGCNTIIDTFIIRSQNIEFSLGNDSTLCSSSSLELKVDLPGATVMWQDFSTNQSFTAKQNGQYWVTVNKDGCTAKDTILLTFKNIAQHLGPDTSICKGTSIDIPLLARVTPLANVLWSSGSTDERITAIDTGLWWVRVIDTPCVASDSIYVSSVFCNCSFMVPNAFSPNGDGLNDVFVPIIESGCPVINYTFSIYNRFGQRVFTSTRPGSGWDGSYKGQIEEAGTYFYELYFKAGSDPKTFHPKGDITLIR